MISHINHNHTSSKCRRRLPTIIQSGDINCFRNFNRSDLAKHSKLTPNALYRLEKCLWQRTPSVAPCVSASFLRCNAWKLLQAIGFSFSTSVPAGTTLGELWYIHGGGRPHRSQWSRSLVWRKPPSAKKGDHPAFSGANVLHRRLS